MRGKLQKKEKNMFVCIDLIYALINTNYLLQWYKNI